MNKVPLTTFLCLLLFSAILSIAQPSKFDITIHSRVDTSKAEIKEVAKLWIKYLHSTPDSLYNNPFWNKSEKINYKNFDFSVPYLYQFPSHQLFTYYKPTILSIEKEGNYYGIRTIFAADGLEGEYRKSNPWCITKLYATKENGNWKLINALPVITETWKTKTIGKISFIYPPDHKFNEDLAKKATIFCNEITEQFQFPEWKPFSIYITKNGDELGKLLNFDFYFAGYTTGISMNENRILLTGQGLEYFPHELIHLIVPNFDRHPLIEEGFATWQGGTAEKSFVESAALLANKLSVNKTVTFIDVLNKKWGWQHNAFYTSGAILCKAVYEKGGTLLIKKLLKTPDNNEALVQNICTAFEIKEEELDTFWRKEVLKFKKYE